VNWVDWFNWFPNTKEEADLFFTILLFIFTYLYVLRPRKKEYKNIFLAWLAFLASTTLTIGLLYFLLSRRLVPLNIGPGINTFFWGAISVPVFFLDMAFMNAITKILKIKRLPTHKEDRVSGVDKPPHR
jgi:hypothetical protein